jgi:hypothetical protein
MAGNRSDEYELVVRTLSHEWILVETLIERLLDKIPPGKAKRRYEEVLEAARRSRKHTGTGQPKPLVSEDRQIESGARSLIQRALHSARIAGTILVDVDENGARRARNNIFDAAYLDKVLADKATKSATPVVAPPVQARPVPSTISTLPPPSSSEKRFYPMLFDHRTIKRELKVQANPDTNVIVITIADVDDEHDLQICVSPPAADWFGDQLGMQAMILRGRQSRSKIFPPGS